MQRSVGRAFFAWILFCVATATYADAVTDRAAALLKRQDAKGAYAEATRLHLEANDCFDAVGDRGGTLHGHR